MSLLSLIPTPVLAAGGVVAAAAIFAGGWKVEGWRATDALDTEKAAHARDVKALQDDWQAKLNAAQALLTEAIKERDAERAANAAAREAAANVHEATIAKLSATAASTAAELGRVRNDLAAAEAAGRAARSEDPVRQAAAGAAACSGSSEAICGLFYRALDIAKRCADSAGSQHAAAVEALATWPR
jgi:hypothetical protein